MKKAQAEANKGEDERNKAGTKAKQGEPKEHPAVHTTKIPGEAVIVRIVPKQFTMTTTKLWSAMKATIEERAVKGAKIKSNTRYRYFEAFKKSTGPEEFARLFPDEAPENPTASAPLAETGEGTAGAGAGKPTATEEKALNALKEADAEGPKADSQANKTDAKAKKTETKAPPSFRSTNIPGEAVIVTIVPKQFTMTTNTS